MTKHTKGPWHIRAERYRFIHVTASGGGIAHLDTIDGEGMANARLIAAAPDLLEALTDLLSAHHHSKGDEWVDAAYAAIAKAQGRAS